MLRPQLTLVLAALALTATLPVSAAGPADTRDVEAVLATYKAALERLDVTGTQKLFTADSQIFENGGVEGTYANYLKHHIAPELAAFKSFKFADYKVSVRFEGPVAIATESYTYRIDPKTGDVAERRGVATSVLVKRNGHWQIAMTHSSSRKPKTP